MLRMALVPVFVLLTLGRNFTWALVVFAVAGLTDALDGYVARHSGQITRLGAMLDPIADKLLTASAYVLLTWGGVATCVLPVWLTVTLLFRDVMLLVGVVVVNLSLGPIEFPPSRLGKASTARQRADRRGRAGRKRDGRVPAGSVLAVPVDGGHADRHHGPLHLPRK